MNLSASLRRPLTVAAMAALSLSTFGATASAVPVEPAASGCAPVGVVSARGTFEPQDGSWLQKPVGDRVAEALPGQTSYTELEYPAAPNFDSSPAAGVKALVELLNTRARECPDQRYVLIGYSQGAQVTGDSLVPPSQRLVGRDAGEVSAAASERIAAIVLYGNPRFVGGEPFNAGDHDPASNGDKPRAKGDLDAYAPRIRDFCVRGDLVCQQGGNPISHLFYFVNGAQDEGAAFAVSRLAT